MQADIIKEHQKAIKAKHGCDARHIESAVIREKFEGQTVWEGIVEIFEVTGHPKAKRAYAWTYRDGDQDKTMAVLGIPPVDSPQAAVKVAIAAKAKQQG
jgi:hypothetical protein